MSAVRLVQQLGRNRAIPNVTELTTTETGTHS